MQITAQEISRGVTVKDYKQHINGVREFLHILASRPRKRSVMSDGESNWAKDEGMDAGLNGL